MATAHRNSAWREPGVQDEKCTAAFGSAKEVRSCCVSSLAVISSRDGLDFPVRFNVGLGSKATFEEGPVLAQSGPTAHV